MFDVTLTKEWTEIRRDGRVRFCGLAVAVLLLIAMAGSWLDWSWYDQESRIGATNAERQFAEQEEKHPHSAAHLGVYAWKPAAPLSVLDPGINPQAGMTVWLEPHAISPATLRPEQSLTALEKATRFSPSEVLRIFAPLLIVLVGVALFAGEREMGTLRQTLSIGVSRWQLLQGKATVAAAAPLLLVGVFIAAGLFAVAGAEAPFGQADAAVRLALMAVGFLLYAATWVGLTLGVSALARSVRTALLVLVSLWALQTWVVPQAAGNLARLGAPILTPTEFVSTALATRADRQAELDGLLTAATDQMLHEHSVESERDLPFNPDGVRFEISEDFLNAIFDEQLTAQRAAFGRQRGDLLAASAVAPSIALRAWSMAAAGTDYTHHLHFADAAEAYRRVLVNYSHDALLDTEPGAAYASILVDREWLEAAPDFTYTPMAVGQGVRPAVGSLLVLALWALAATAFAGWAVQSLRP